MSWWFISSAVQHLGGGSQRIWRSARGILILRKITLLAFLPLWWTVFAEVVDDSTSALRRRELRAASPTSAEDISDSPLARPYSCPVDAPDLEVEEFGDDIPIGGGYKKSSVLLVFDVHLPILREDRAVDDGLLFESGGQGTGVFLGLQDNLLRLSVGHGGDKGSVTSDRNTAVIALRAEEVETSPGKKPFDGQRHEIAVYIRSGHETKGAAEVQLFIDGVLLGEVATATVKTWAGADASGFGATSGTSVANGGTRENWPEHAQGGRMRLWICDVTTTTSTTSSSSTATTTTTTFTRKGSLTLARPYSCPADGPDLEFAHFDGNVPVHNSYKTESVLLVFDVHLPTLRADPANRVDNGLLFEAGGSWVGMFLGLQDDLLRVSAGEGKDGGSVTSDENTAVIALRVDDVETSPGKNPFDGEEHEIAVYIRTRRETKTTAEMQLFIDGFLVGEAMTASFIKWAGSDAGGFGVLGPGSIANGGPSDPWPEYAQGGHMRLFKCDITTSTTSSATTTTATTASTTSATRSTTSATVTTATTSVTSATTSMTTATTSMTTATTSATTATTSVSTPTSFATTATSSLSVTTTAATRSSASKTTTSGSGSSTLSTTVTKTSTASTTSQLFLMEILFSGDNGTDNRTSTAAPLDESAGLRDVNASVATTVSVDSEEEEHHGLIMLLEKNTSSFRNASSAEAAGALQEQRVVEVERQVVQFQAEASLGKLHSAALEKIEQKRSATQAALARAICAALYQRLGGGVNTGSRGSSMDENESTTRIDLSDHFTGVADKRNLIASEPLKNGVASFSGDPYLGDALRSVRCVVSLEYISTKSRISPILDRRKLQQPDELSGGDNPAVLDDNIMNILDDSRDVVAEMNWTVIAEGAPHTSTVQDHIVETQRILTTAGMVEGSSVTDENVPNSGQGTNTTSIENAEHIGPISPSGTEEDQLLARFLSGLLSAQAEEPVNVELVPVARDKFAAGVEPAAVVQRVVALPDEENQVDNTKSTNSTNSSSREETKSSANINGTGADLAEIKGDLPPDALVTDTLPKEQILFSPGTATSSTHGSVEAVTDPKSDDELLSSSGAAVVVAVLGVLLLVVVLIIWRFQLVRGSCGFLKFLFGASDDGDVKRVSSEFSTSTKKIAPLTSRSSVDLEVANCPDPSSRSPETALPGAFTPVSLISLPTGRNSPRKRRASACASDSSTCSGLSGHTSALKIDTRSSCSAERLQERCATPNKVILHCDNSVRHHLRRTRSSEADKAAPTNGHEFLDDLFMQLQKEQELSSGVAKFSSAKEGDTSSSAAPYGRAGVEVVPTCSFRNYNSRTPPLPPPNEVVDTNLGAPRNSNFRRQSAELQRPGRRPEIPGTPASGASTASVFDAWA